MNCPKCGEVLGENARVCEHCGTAVPAEATPVAQPAAPETPAAEQKPEKVLTGTIGALIGAIIGGAVVILMSRFGYVASLSGLAIAISVVEGYDLFGGRKPAKGLWICLLIMAVTPYIADRIDWAIVLVKEYGAENMSFGEAFAEIPSMIGNGIETKDYIKNLVLLYIFAFLGAFSTLKDLFKKK